MDEHHPVKGRFAPSPTGRIHAGNIFSSLMQWLVVRSQEGSIVFRVDDLDRDRSKPDLTQQVLRDYELLGLTWDEGPFYQQDRDDAYEAALEKLKEKGLVYPCFCTRADLHAASAPHFGEKLIYPGTCKGLTSEEIEVRSKTRKPSLRVSVPDRHYGFYDLVQGHYGQNLAQDCGDFIIRRSDGLFAYQLACVVDDADQGVNCIVRGVDLITSTPQQRFLQEALELPVANYAHVPLFVAQANRRLSKRDHDASLDEMMRAYGTPEGVIGHIAFIAGLQSVDEPASPDELLKVFNMDDLPDLFDDPVQIHWKA